MIFVNDDLKMIKKHYGENMMHLARNLFPAILEQKGLLWKLFSENFDFNRSLCEDIMQNGRVTLFKNYIYHKAGIIEEFDHLGNVLPPDELLSKAGYHLYTCRSEDDIQKFKKYFAPGEELCTFNDNRLRRCYVFFAVKKDVDKIKRENFPHPLRQDEYGTSVISIQFSRDDYNTLLITNRYNHHVQDPNNTFSCNLDNIIAGLTESFAVFYGMEQRTTTEAFELNGYVRASDGKYYKYFLEKNNIYYCYNNVIIDNFVVKKLPLEKYIMFNTFLIDLVNKKVKVYDNTLQDSFPTSIPNIKKIEVLNDDDTKEISIFPSDEKQGVINITVQNHTIIKYKNNNVKSVPSHFLSSIGSLESLEMNNLIITGSYFLQNITSLEKMKLYNLEHLGDGSLTMISGEKQLDFPLLKTIGENAFYNAKIKTFYAPRLTVIGSSAFRLCDKLESFIAPNLKIIGSNVLENNQELSYLNAPSLEVVGKNVLSKNDKLPSYVIESITTMGENSFAKIRERMENEEISSSPKR